VRLPNADLAVVEDAKVRDYLLSGYHPVGRFKSVAFLALGFSGDHWQLLRDALLQLAFTGDASTGQPSPFGLKFEICAILRGPSGCQANVVTVWLVSNGLDFPSLRDSLPWVTCSTCSTPSSWIGTYRSTVSVVVISALSSTFTRQTVLKSSLCSLRARPRHSSAFVASTFARCKTAT
jgi:hypothetical protein